MSIFHETMREILDDVQKFLNLTLQREHLTAASISHRESLLMKIHHLRIEYPQLHLQLITESSSACSTLSNNSGQHDSLLQSTAARSISGQLQSNTPPYIDMQGNNVNSDYVYSDTANVDDEYEVCDVVDSDRQFNDNKMVSEEGESSNDNNYKEQEIPNTPASDLANVVKCGYLEKKGKDRLGGWLNLFQKRFVALKDNVLYIYNKNSDKKPYCMLPLDGYDVRSASTEDGNKKETSFELVGLGKKTYQFVAATNIEARAWIEAVQKMIAVIPRESLKPIVNTVIDSANSVSVITADSMTNSSTISISKDDIYEVVEDKTNPESTSFTEDELYEDAANSTETITDRTVDNSVFVQVDNPLDWYVGLWDCTSIAADELNFNRGDLIHIVNRDYDDFRWWTGDRNGQIGLVPKDYLMQAYEAVDSVMCVM